MQMSFGSLMGVLQQLIGMLQSLMGYGGDAPFGSGNCQCPFGSGGCQPAGLRPEPRPFHPPATSVSFKMHRVRARAIRICPSTGAPGTT